MNQKFTLISTSKPGIRLRTIETADIEDLRLWKNANSLSFFLKEKISPEGQKEWFKGYLARPQDFMFLIESGGLHAGCMGFRILERAADLYNIIGAPGTQGKGIMKEAMLIMCGFIRNEYTKEIRCLVLKKNPALDWYLKSGYRVVSEYPDHYKLELDTERFPPCAYRKIGEIPKL
jgi:ribosomal protein S18 acetylase RimI-like enzyme